MKLKFQKIRETIKRAAAGDAAAITEAQRILEADFSYDERYQALYAALRAMNASETIYVWRCIEDVYDTWFVYEEYREGVERLYRADYTISDGGDVTITNPQRVKVAYELLPVPVQESDRRGVRETAIAARAQEKAIGPDGTMEICIIKAGEGSSGRYTRTVLERDIPRIFPPGTQMFANHLSLEEEINQPEGRIEFLAAETVSAPVWKSGAVGEGMYARCKPFSDWAPTLDDKAHAIGVSISAWGTGKFGDDGVLEFTNLTEGRSIDFVTKAGAGGAIVPINEARRPKTTATTSPTSPTPQETTPKMNPTEETQLREAAGRVPALEAEIARLKEAAIFNQARSVADSVLSAIEMPDLTRARVAEAMSKKPVLKDGALDVEAFKTQVNEAATAELEYLQKAANYGTGKVEGQGAQESKRDEHNPAEIEAQLTEAFKDLGLSEVAAGHAASGR